MAAKRVEVKLVVVGDGAVGKTYVIVFCRFFFFSLVVGCFDTFWMMCGFSW
jgi:hypothetical protein